jgi:hypothetical protein
VPAVHQLFSEFGGIVVEVARNRWPAFEKELVGGDVPYRRLGETNDGRVMTVEMGEIKTELSLDELASAQEGDVAGLLG